jgi:DHA2 family multidrug resistance protein
LSDNELGTPVQVTADAGPLANAPMQGLNLVFATLALGMGSFMNILDLSIANVSVPTIAGDLGVSPTQGTWVITSYAVSEAIMMPLTGWLAGRFGQVRMFVVATALFTLASVFCGSSPSFPILLSSRVLQGMAGASMIPLSQTLITSIFPPERRGLGLGIWAMTTVVAPIAGPLAGGWFTDNLTWHWIFLMNLPFGILVASLVSVLFRGRESQRRKLPVDLVGLGLLIIGVGSLQILLDKGNELDWFGSNLIIALASLSAFALALFVAWELTEEHPVVNLRLFAKRNFLVGAISLLVGTVGFFGVIVVLPLWLQSYQGYTSMWAGKVVAFGGVLAVILGPIVGANIHRIDARIVSTFGFTTFALVAFWSTRFTPDVDFWTVATTRLLMGIGISCFFLPLVTISLSGLAPTQIAAAAGITNFMRNIGSSFGTAALTSFWVNEATRQHAIMSEHINAYNPQYLHYLGRLRTLGMPPGQTGAYIDHLISVQAHLIATDSVMALSGTLMLALVGVVWWARPPFIARGGDH